MKTAGALRGTRSFVLRVPETAVSHLIFTVNKMEGELRFL